MKCKIDLHTTSMAVGSAIAVLLGHDDFRSITWFAHGFNEAGQRIRLTKKMFGKKFDGAIEINIGKPNYREREFLKLCKKANTSPRDYWVNRKIKK